MTNGDNINNLAEFEGHLREMKDRELQEFTARRVYQLSEDFRTCQRDCKGRIKVLEDSNKKNATIGGTIGAAALGAAYFLWQIYKG